MPGELKPLWAKYIKYDWKLGFILILLICIPRFILVLNANVTNNYGPIALIMIISGLVPFILMTKQGRSQIGILKTKKINQLILAFFIGFLISIVLYFLGDFIYSDSYSNWYKYIGKSYNIPSELSPRDKHMYFVIFAITGMTFSPIGEELFFRGIVHSSFATSISDFKSSVIDSSAFAITHISHFGLIYVMNEWKFLLIPAAIWTSFIFSIGLVFFYFKKTTGSILGAIICHAGFNLGMTYAIFYLF